MVARCKHGECEGRCGGLGGGCGGVMRGGASARACNLRASGVVAWCKRCAGVVLALGWWSAVGPAGGLVGEWLVGAAWPAAVAFVVCVALVVEGVSAWPVGAVGDVLVPRCSPALVAGVVSSSSGGRWVRLERGCARACGALGACGWGVTLPGVLSWRSGAVPGAPEQVPAVIPACRPWPRSSPTSTSPPRSQPLSAAGAHDHPDTPPHPRTAPHAPLQRA